MAKSNFIGEVLHFNAIRMRITGSGNLISRLLSLDDVNSYNMANLAMTSSTAKEPVLLANFKSQRGYLELSTTEINEYFNISKIIIFVKPVETGLPQ